MTDITLDYTDKSYSTMPFGMKHTVKKVAATNVVVMRFDSSNPTNVGDFVPFTHPKMRVPKYDEPGYVYGISHAFNETTNKNVLPYIKTVTNRRIIFDSNYVKTGDIIEVTYYSTYLDVKSDSDLTQTGANLDRVDQEWVEQLFRFASQLDRTDFGTHTPPFRHAITQDGTYDSAQYTWHPRLFFAHNGWFHEHSRHSGTAYSCGPLTNTPITVLQWAPYAPHSVGAFIGDPAFGSVVGGNEHYSVIPTPIHPTVLTFFCKLKNDTYDADAGDAIKLTLNVDGSSYSMGTSPRYLDSTDVYSIVNRFGTDYDLYLSFSKAYNYEGLTPVYEHAETMDDGESGTTNYYIARKLLNGIRINNGLTISASTVGLSETVEELSEWYLTIGGMIPYSYSA